MTDSVRQLGSTEPAELTVNMEKATGSNSIVQDKYVTVSVAKKDIEDARTYFSRVGTDLISHFGRLGSVCTELDGEARLRIIHDFMSQAGKM